jgi:hypothetical protein
MFYTNGIKALIKPECSQRGIIWLHPWAGMDPAWSGRGGGGGGGCSASSGAKLCRSCVPPAHQLASLLNCKVLLDYCIWIVIVVHSLLIIMLLLKLLYLILSLIIVCFIMKNSTPPLHPFWPSIPVHECCLFGGCKRKAALHYQSFCDDSRNLE